MCHLEILQSVDTNYILSYIQNKLFIFKITIKISILYQNIKNARQFWEGKYFNQISLGNLLIIYQNKILYIIKELFYQFKGRQPLPLMSSNYSQSSRLYAITSASQLYKFNFSDFHIAHQIHLYIKQRLIPYDINNNGKFEERQIRNALVQILGESQQQLQYVVLNVFRYDRDNDGAVTYEQFIKFFLEQHLGEMAIQRLHRQNKYENASKRIMNQKQFIQTLQYGFNNIKFIVSDSQLSALFSQVDLDRDGLISYEDYFNFLREYFASKRIDSANEDRQPTIHSQSYKKNILRIGKLIFPQIRSILIEHDLRRGMALSEDQIRAFIRKNFKHSINTSAIQQQNYTLPSFPINKSDANYLQCLKIIIETVLSPDLNNNNFINSYYYSQSNKSLTNEQFIYNFFQNQLKAIRVKPARYMLDQIYQYLSQQNKKQGFTQKTYSQLLRDIAKTFNPQNRSLV